MTDQAPKSGAPGSSRLSGRSAGSLGLGGSAPSSGPINTPGNSAVFGGASVGTGMSPSLSSLGLSGQESADEGGEDQTVTPAPIVRIGGEAATGESPSVGASQRAKRRGRGSGRPDAPKEQVGGEETPQNPKGTVRFQDASDSEVERKHREKVQEEEEIYARKYEEVKETYDKELQNREKEIDEKIAVYRQRALDKYQEKTKKLEVVYQEIMEQTKKSIAMSAEEIREHQAQEEEKEREETVRREQEQLEKEREEEEKRERESERRKREAVRKQRGSLLTTQAERDAEILKSIYEDPTRLAALQSINDEKLPTLTPRKSAIASGLAGSSKAPRASLGAPVPVFSAHTPYTPKVMSNQQQVPTGGYLANIFATSTPKADIGKGKAKEESSDDELVYTRVGAGAPDGGDSSSSGSSSSDDEYKKMSLPEKRAYKKVKKEQRRKAESRSREKAEEKKKKEKLEKLKLSGYRTKLPSTYEGAADYEAYEQWLFEINTWVEDTGFDQDEAVKHVKSFLKGKAGTFYMYNVAPRPQEYDLIKLTTELFAYCFPPDIIARLRYRFDNMKQSDRGFKDFVRELQKYQIRLRDVGDIQIAQRIWTGAHNYIRAKWTDAGMSVDGTPLSVLIETGTRFEMAEKIRKSEEDRSKKENNSYKPYKAPFKQTRSNDSSAESNNINYASRNSTARKPYSSSSTSNNSGYKSNYNNNGGFKRNGSNGNRPKIQGPKLSKEQVEEYRAAGKCFTCSEVGHNSRDCPKRNQARPSNISSSAINFAHIESLGAKRPELELSAVDFDDGDNADDEGEDLPMVEVNAIRTKKNVVREEVE